MRISFGDKEELFLAVKMRNISRFHPYLSIILRAVTNVYVTRSPRNLFSFPFSLSSLSCHIVDTLNKSPK